MAEKAPFSLKLAATAVLLFLHIPVWIILLYAFTTDEATYSFPPPGLTTRWFGVAFGRQDFWDALGLSLRVAGMATLLALILGSLAAVAVYRSRFFGREAISVLLALLACQLSSQASPCDRIGMGDIL
jgi:putative spermidine/putrescine transport system permease protein